MSEQSTKRTLGVVLFPEFELLDAAGPLEMYGLLKSDIDIVTVAEKAGAVMSYTGVTMNAEATLVGAPDLDLLLVPGGVGTRDEVYNEKLLAWLRARCEDAELVTSVCTGSALLARAGVLDGKKATSNKMAFQWVVEQGPNVDWIKEARWVEDGKFFTSSGVSAGMDMALAAIGRLSGNGTSEELAKWTEYEWHRDPSWDPFAKMWGLV